jgi:hypothetical protein
VQGVQGFCIAALGMRIIIIKAIIENLCTGMHKALKITHSPTLPDKNYTHKL